MMVRDNAINSKKEINEIWRSINFTDCILEEKLILEGKFQFCMQKRKQNRLFLPTFSKFS